MSKTTNPGTDYGLGQSNIDKANGIRFGVISQHSIMPECFDDFEADYGKPHCPHCGEELAMAIDCNPCPHCQKDIDDTADCYPEEPIGHYYDKQGYKIVDCLDSDWMIIKSPYFTYAQYCSPCVPGAGNLDSPCETGPKTYCLGHDWFENEEAPYPVFSVETGKQVPVEHASE